MAYRGKRLNQCILEQYNSPYPEQNETYQANNLYENSYVNQGTMDSELENQLTETSEVQPFSFACELAQGSKTVRISGFSSIPQLYARISERFAIPISTVCYMC